jgi:hypothetical protein
MTKILVASLVAEAMLGLSASYSVGSAAQQFTLDVTGIALVCTDTTYTIVSGSVQIVSHEDVTASGNTNVTITVIPQNVVAAD